MQDKNTLQDLISRLFDRTYVVSLVRSIDRREHIRHHFADIGLKSYSFFDATDSNAPEVAEAYATGQVMTYPPCFRCGKDSCGKEHCNNVLIPPQVAVYITYMRLWKKIASETQRALILEDDVLFQCDVGTTLQRLSEAIALGKVTWSADQPRLLRLGWALGSEHETGTTFRLTEDIRMSNPCHSITSAYAQTLIDRHKKIMSTVDVYVHETAPRRGEALTVIPPIASELSWSRGSLESLIHPKTIRTHYLRQLGDEEGAKENEHSVRHHKAHATLECPLAISAAPKVPRRPMTSHERWQDQSAFSPAWSARNAAMLALCEERLDRTTTTKFAEYGCGPHAPFSSLVAIAGYAEALRYDLAEWNFANRQLDLNRLPFEVERTTIGVLSGVIEYLNDVRATLRCLSAAHDYLLFSYAIAPNKSALSDVVHVSLLNERSSIHGWRNHFDLTELTSLLGEHGFLEGIQMFGDQIIALLRTFESRETL